MKNWGKVKQVLNLNVYGSLWGIFSREYNVVSPIIRVNNVGDVSIDGSLVENVLENLREELDSSIDELLLIGHSMGGLIWRAMLKAVIIPEEDRWLWKKNSPEVKCIVQLATPNKGSKLTSHGIIRTIDRVQSAILLKFTSYIIKFAKSIGQKVGLVEESKLKTDVQSDENNRQIKQMEPKSRFIKWLNSEPIHTDKVPHFAFAGKKNSFYITNPVWKENTNDITIEELENVLQKQYPNEDITDILTKYNLHENISNKKIRKILDDLDVELDKREEDGFIDNLKLMFNPNSASVQPNDGYVSVEDVKLEGIEYVDIGDAAEKLSHWGICSWYLPFEQYNIIRDEVIEILSRFLPDNDN